MGQRRRSAMPTSISRSIFRPPGDSSGREPAVLPPYTFATGATVRSVSASSSRAARSSGPSSSPRCASYPAAGGIPTSIVCPAWSLPKQTATCKKSLPRSGAARRSVRCEIGLIAGIGRLTVYDVATRIGAHVDLAPERAYLHAGTATGAKGTGNRSGRGGQPSGVARCLPPARGLRD
jgi:hypothetical protein